MIREKRLSPGRSRFSLAFLVLLGEPTVRLRPLLILRPHPPRDGKPRSETRFCTPVSTLLFDARFRSARLAAAVRLSPTARLRRKSTVCGLSGLRPGFAGSPPIKSSTRLGKLAALAPESFCAVSTGELPSPVWKEKLPCKPIFLSNPGIVRFLESKRKAQPGASRNGDGQLTNNN